jgi:flagellar basal-body rod modification protein FlgD
MPGTVSTVTQQLFDQLAPQASSKEPTKQLGKEDFLKLLTLQLRSQNPLNPASNQEMAAQLAQFSALEQMQNISVTLEQLLQSNASLALSIAQYSAPALIGRTATASVTDSSGARVSFDGSVPIQLGYELGSTAANATIEIRSSTGAIVRTITVPASQLQQGSHTIEWDGRDDRGNALPSGTYSYVVRATDADGKALSASPLISGRITGIRYTSQGLVVLLGSIEVPIANIVELS